MRYVLEDLVRIRRLREDRAQREVVKRRHDVEKAFQLLVERKQQLSDYTGWRLEKEELLYGRVRNKVISLKDLDDLRAEVSFMRDQEAALAKAVQDAEAELRTAREGLERAKADYHLAVKESRKIDEHKTLWVAETNKEEEQAAEKEMEDFHTKVETSEHDWNSEYEGF